MNLTLSSLEPCDRKKVSAFEDRLGTPFRPQWPTLPVGACVELQKAFESVPAALSWLKKQKKKDWLAALEVGDGATEASLVEALGRLGDAKISRLRVTLGDDFSSRWVKRLPASVVHLGLELWASTSFGDVLEGRRAREGAGGGPLADRLRRGSTCRSWCWRERSPT